MSCDRCNEGPVYDLACQPCRSRLVRSCRSGRAPTEVRRHQEAMLAAIERSQGSVAMYQTIDDLRATVARATPQQARGVAAQG